MYSRLTYLWLLPLAIGLTISACSKSKEKPTPPSAQKTSGWDRTAAQAKYQLIQTEIQLANSEKLYAVINFAKKELQLKLKGAVVWNYPLEIVNGDSEAVKHFWTRFQNDKGLLVRPVTKKHLFAAQELNPDSVLEIVGEVLNIKPELLQRDIPSRFQIQWGNNLIMDIYTDIEGKPVSLLENTIVEVTQTLNRPFREAVLTIKMRPEAAITFYRAIDIDTPTLIYPPSL